MSRRLVASLCIMAGAAVALSGCGASQAVDPVARAATATLASSGYKLSATMTVTGGGAHVSASLTGAINTATNRGTMTIDESVDGQRIRAPMIFSGLNFWMKSSAIAGAAARTGGKPWIYLDMSKSLGAAGMSSLPTTLNPGQYLGYLRAAGATPTRLGQVSINRVRTIEYRATVDLDRYEQRYHVPAKTISLLESTLGRHSLPVEAWIDSQNRVRRIHISFPECVGGSKLQFSMTMGVYGFGSRPQVQIPARRAVYNLTPLVTSETRSVPLGC